MFRPNQTCTVRKKGGFDQYGQETLGASYDEPCAVVQLRKVATPTTVRADSSASRGHGEEFITYNRFLLGKNTVASIEDRILIAGQTYRIIDMHARFNIEGRLDHYECEGRVA